MDDAGPDLAANDDNEQHTLKTSTNNKVQSSLETSQSPAKAVSQSTQETQLSAQDNAPKVKVCVVCNANEGKYKCSRCYLPYCSVACSKLHKATHPADEPIPKIEKPTTPPKPNSTVPRPGTVAAAGYKGPFAALDESRELQELFKMYPSLPSQLEEINAATLRPVEDERRASRKGRKAEPWTSDRGLQKGREALCRARNISGKDGEGIREFSKLVLQILSGENGTRAAEVIQKEMEVENVRIIEQLLNNER